jgi:peroxiredoxin
MSRRALIATCVLLAAVPVLAADRLPPPVQLDRDAQANPGWVSDGETAGRLAIGDPAPAFSYLGSDGAWHPFRQMIAGGPIVLVFGARNEQLAELDRALPALARLGARPVAAFDMRPGSAARLARRLSLRCGVIADPQCAIAGLYGSLDPVTQRHAPAYFVLDERGTIRGSGRGAIPAARELVAVTAKSLGRALPAAMSLSNRDSGAPSATE